MKNTYVKSPLNYVGGKYKLLSEIIPLFPSDIDTFVDLFGGGANVLINTKAQSYIYNDIESHVVELLDYLYHHTTESCLAEIDNLIDKFKLSKENAEGFTKIRDYYNDGNSLPMVFYTMICHAFNYQIRFNRRGKYNMPFGKARSSFNPALRQKFITFTDALHSIKVDFQNQNFQNFDFSEITTSDFVYCDPPYFNSTAAYNEQGGWTENDEKALLSLLDELNNRGVRWALSNNLKYDNPILDGWKDKYNVHYLNGDYSNCNYHKIDRSKDIEVLITNY